MQQIGVLRKKVIPKVQTKEIIKKKMIKNHFQRKNNVVIRNASFYKLIIVMWHCKNNKSSI